MDCREAGERMHAVLDGSAGDADRALLEGHAALCAGCRGRLEALRAVDRLVASPLGTEAADEGRAKERLLARLEREGLLAPPREGKVVPLPVRRLLPPVALGAAAAALAALLLWRAAPRPVPPPAPVAKAARPAGPSGQGVAGGAAAPAAVPSSLAPEEREMVALLDLLESPDFTDREGRAVEDFLMGPEEGRG